MIKTHIVRKVAVFIVAGTASFTGSDAAPRPAAPEMITIHLSNFSLDPGHLRLHSGSAVELHIVNDSNGGHNLSAPELFAASVFPGSTPPVDGKVEVGAKLSVDLLFVPQLPGTYKVECSHFLHSLFGMTGSVVVEGPTHKSEF